MISLSLTYALPIASMLNGLLTSSAETEQELVAVERTLRYTDHVPAEVRRLLCEAERWSFAARDCGNAAQPEPSHDILRAGTQEGGDAAPQSKDTHAQELHRDGTWPDRSIANQCSPS